MNDNEGYLRARFYDDGDGSGKLCVHVVVDRFSGEGGAYFGIEELERFAEQIAAYPLPAERRVSLAGGYWSSTEPGKLEDEHLGLEVYPVGRRGQIGVRARVATVIASNERSGSQNSAQIELLTTYEPMSRFARELTALVHGRADSALLSGHRMG
ncbi:MAG TPA: hypothetical protein VM686_23135 [Polyangiaceae bacterium]|nr:hypothetical protein [Polyangiaceae bacterium]